MSGGTCLEEQAVLQTTEVLEMLVSPETHVQIAHAGREVLVRHLVNHIRSQRTIRTLSRSGPF